MAAAKGGCARNQRATRHKGANEVWPLFGQNLCRCRDQPPQAASVLAGNQATGLTIFNITRKQRQRFAKGQIRVIYASIRLADTERNDQIGVRLLGAAYKFL